MVKWLIWILSEKQKENNEDEVLCFLMQKSLLQWKIEN